MTAEELIKKSEAQLTAQFALADEISEYNQEKVLKARAVGRNRRGGERSDCCGRIHL